MQIYKKNCSRNVPLQQKITFMNPIQRLISNIHKQNQRWWCLSFYEYKILDWNKVQTCTIFWSQSFFCEIRGAFQKGYEILKLGALKSSLLNRLHIFKCMDRIFCAEFQRVPLKFHTKYLSNTWKDMTSVPSWKFKSSEIYELVCVFFNASPDHSAWSV